MTDSSPNSNTNTGAEIYDVIAFWDQNSDESPAKKAAFAKHLNIVYDYNASLSLKLMFEAQDIGKTVVFTTRKLDKAVASRDQLTSLGIFSHVRPVSLDIQGINKSGS